MSCSEQNPFGKSAKAATSYKTMLTKFFSRVRTLFWPSSQLNVRTAERTVAHMSLLTTSSPSELSKEEDVVFRRSNKLVEQKATGHDDPSKFVEFFANHYDAAFQTKDR